MSIGVGQIIGQVTAKPEPRTSGKVTYFNIEIADVGWKQRYACTGELYHSVEVSEQKRVFTGKLEAVRAQRVGGKFPDDYLAITLERAKDHVPSAAPAPAAKG